MSKNSFCNQVLNDMSDRFLYLRNNAISEFLKPTDIFKLSLCLTYMVLVKDKIIAKDESNPDPLGRIENRVDKAFIEDLFNPNNSYAPIIHSSLEKDPVWILDCFRDAFMHEKVEIDEANQCVLIHNDRSDRYLDATVPFEWFKVYMEKNLYQYRYTNHFTKTLFYRDAYANSNSKYKTRNVVDHSILYRINIKGNNLPIEELEEDISHIMNRISDINISEEEVEEFRKEFPSRNSDEDFKYCISFEKAIRFLKSVILEKYPNSTFEFHIIDDNSDYKKNIKEKSAKYLQNSFINYEDLYLQLNGLLEKKSDAFLKCLLEVYDYVVHFDEHNPEEISVFDWIDEMKRIALTDKFSISDDIQVNNYYYTQASNLLKSVLLHVFGFATVVLNEESIKESVKNIDLTERMPSYSEDAFFDTALVVRSKWKLLLEKKISLCEFQSHLQKATEKNNQAGIKRLTAIIESIKLDIFDLQNELDYIRGHYDEKYKTNVNVEDLYLIRNGVKQTLSILYSQFEKETDKSIKERIMKDILDAFDEEITFEKGLVYGICDSPHTMDVFRNSFSHLTRVRIDSFFDNERIFFTDFDKDNKISGYGRCYCADFIDLMGECLNGQKTGNNPKVYSYSS